MPDHYHNLVEVVRTNLEHQQDWSDVRLHGDSSEASSENLPRLLLTGLPPRRMYIHPDEQIALLQAERSLPAGQRIPQPPEYEWVLPLHLAETPSLRLFASVFDAISACPREVPDVSEVSDGDAAWAQWRGPRRAKRLLLAVVQDDSSIVYYFVHDGIVKPRQN